MRILGVSAFYHDSAAALVVDGEIIAAAQEERFSRVKHDARFPASAIRYCLDASGLTLTDIDHVVFYEKPFVKFERLLETYTAMAPKGFSSFRRALPVWLREKLFQKDLLIGALKDIDEGFDAVDRLLFSDHHMSHAASAYYPSPFDRATVLTLDGVGEWATTTMGVGDGCDLTLTHDLQFPHSLGLLYSAFTYYCGFRVNSGEYKLMGLAPYGTPRFTQAILDNLVDIKPDGSFRLNMRFFDYATGMRMTNKRFATVFGAPARKAEDAISAHYMDVAASIQAVTEEIMLKLVNHVVAETGVSTLCLAGGVALNCVANGRILRESTVDDVWIQPAAGDAGGALGAALAAYHQHSGGERPALGDRPDRMAGSYLGTEYSQADIERRLTEAGAKFEVIEDDAQYLDRAAQRLSEGAAVGWFQGRMEFGPRALGGRSILADPRDGDAQTTLNLKIKFRESFRPFAPSVLAEKAGDWFQLDHASPYMLLVADVATDKQVEPTDEGASVKGLDRRRQVRSTIPAVTHVDYSARVQTVHEDTNPRYHQLLTRFEALTGCPVLVNTSFNVRGEPIVHTPEDAFRCLMGTGMDCLAIGNCWLEKDAQNPDLLVPYHTEFALD
ncbi:MAG: carbamoyltransferase [Pseudomonadota bacterium]